MIRKIKLSVISLSLVGLFGFSNGQSLEISGVNLLNLLGLDQVITGAFNETGSTIVNIPTIQTNNSGYQDYETEFLIAHGWMFANGLTSHELSSYSPESNTTREQITKMIVKLNSLTKKNAKELSNNCNFLDKGLVDATLTDFVVEACQIGTINGYSGYFTPKSNLSKSQLTAILVRLYEGKKSFEGSNIRRQSYFFKAQLLGITNHQNIDTYDKKINRYETALMMYRFFKIFNGTGKVNQSALDKIDEQISKIASGVVGVNIDPIIKDNAGLIIGGISPLQDPVLLQSISRGSINGINQNLTTEGIFDTPNRLEIGTTIFDFYQREFVDTGASIPQLSICQPKDLQNATEIQKQKIIGVCSLGLMKINNGLFNPSNTVIKSDFITIISRIFGSGKNDNININDLGIVSAKEIGSLNYPITRYDMLSILHNLHQKLLVLNNMKSGNPENQLIYIMSGGLAKINTNLLQSENVLLIDTPNQRYKVTKHSEQELLMGYSKARYGILRDLVNEEQVGNISIVLYNGLVLEGIISVSGQNLLIKPIDPFSNTYSIKSY